MNSTTTEDPEDNTAFIILVLNFIATIIVTIINAHQSYQNNDDSFRSDCCGKELVAFEKHRKQSNAMNSPKMSRREILNEMLNNDDDV